MNILFLTENEISPLQGGTEHITQTWAQTLMHDYACNCYSVYRFGTSLPEKTFFTGKQQLEERQPDAFFATFIQQYNIKAIVCNYVRQESKNTILPIAYRIARQYHCKLLMFYHAMPGEDLIGNSLSNAIYRICKTHEWKKNLKEIVLQILPMPLKRRLFGGYLSRKYKQMYKHCDRLVLLSEHFRAPFAALARIPIDDKICVLNSSLSNNDFLPLADIAQKQHEVLVVARFDEKMKRLSLVLRIWKMIEANTDTADWHLTIIGGGIDDKYLWHKAKNMGLRRICFEGRVVDIVPYYKRASLFMMTSAYEGWGLTLTEAQQFGTIPLAFNSYASIVDIITDGENGCLIENNNLNAYAKKLIGLMQNAEQRKKMAVAAIESSKRFAQEKIVKQLYDILQM